MVIFHHFARHLKIHLIIVAATLAELQQSLQDIPDDVPLDWDADAGTLVPIQSCWAVKAEEAGFGTGETSGDEYSGGGAQYFGGQFAAVGDEMTFAFSPEYDMTEWAIGVREAGDPGDNDDDGDVTVPRMRIGIEAVDVENIANVATVSAGDPDWNESLANSTETLEAGETYTVTAEIDEVDHNEYDYGEWIWDVIAIYDTRFDYDFDNELHEPAGYLDGPQELPDVARIETVPVTTPLTILEVALAATSEDGEPIAELGIGIDGTDEFDTVTGATDHSVVYDEPATQARARIGVGRNDAVRNDQTPRTGFEPRGLNSFEITADLDNTPILTNRSFDDRLIDVLEEVSAIGNFVFAVTQDGDKTVVQVTRLEGRQSDVDPDVADYSVDVQTEDVVERAIIYGGAQRVTRQFVAVVIGEWVELPFDGKIVEGQVEITDEAGNERFERGSDYQLRHATAEGTPLLRALADGDLDEGKMVRVDADVKPRGEYEIGTAGDGPRTRIEDLPGLASQQMCEQVALYLVEETGDAVKEVDLTVPHDAVEWSVIEAIDVEKLPGGGPWQTREIDHDAAQTTLQLANRKSVDEVLSEIESGISRNAERL